MRKVLVAGAACAATCLAAVAVPSGALAEPPTPVLSGLESDSTTTAAPSPSTPSPSAGEPSSTSSSSASASTSAAADSSVVSARTVMVTPKPPRERTYPYGRDPRQRIDVYWRAPAKKPARREQPVTGGQEQPGARQTQPSDQQTQQPGGQTQPQTQPPTPARPGVLLLHGGSWRHGDKTGWKYFARRLTTQGFTVFAANYRLSSTAHWPAQRDDAQTALAFVKKHAKAWNVDPDRIVVVGSSAGGHLATQLGTLGEGARQVRGVAALSPVNTPYLAYQDGLLAGASPQRASLRGAVVELLGCVPSEAAAPCWELVDDANSAAHASAGDAPMLLMHSSGDFVPVTQSTGLAGALRSVGVPVTVRTVGGKTHGTDLMNDETVYPALLSWIKARTR
ncbi:alpha/beta hydrolase [Spirillospora sp. NPDC047279]|uniref:alpha/beta hydrolase n=1 Tax=Spirillospora sp. NPDC047279 TaxID=3155478 RepID=UPI0033F54CED